MKMLTRLGLMRAARRRRGGKKSRLTPLGSLALARGTRTGSSAMSAAGTALLVLGAARRRKKRGQLVYRTRLRPGDSLRLAVTRDGDVREG